MAIVTVDRQGLPPAQFRTDLPRVGELAVALGSPLGFENSATAGIISGLNRSIPASGRQSQSLVDLIQTDAPISPGNSGGALVDAQGRVVGISEAYIPPQAGAVSLGFAIPAATAVDVVDQLRRNGRARHAFLGVQVAPLTPEIASQLGVDRSDGVVVLEVVANGPAARAGLQPGDVITKLGDTPTPTVGDFLGELRRRAPGDRVRLEVLRGGQTRTVEVRWRTGRAERVSGPARAAPPPAGTRAPGRSRGRRGRAR
ncbi:MAG TPA: trypsin-like peptidase domain-containing protein [Frankiaceae bacterium]|nr:trypsin-like peptidase domain-containing protein [Frankiaceae bacterium]